MIVSIFTPPVESIHKKDTTLQKLAEALSQIPAWLVKHKAVLSYDEPLNKPKTDEEKIELLKRRIAIDQALIDHPEVKAGFGESSIEAYEQSKQIKEKKLSEILQTVTKQKSLGSI